MNGMNMLLIAISKPDEAAIVKQMTSRILNRNKI
jgi:hypothetical protein